MSFKKNKYKVLKAAISSELAEFVYTYFLNKRTTARFLFDQKYLSPFNTEYGVWNDEQVPNTYSHYGDMVMETLLGKLNDKMNKSKRFNTHIHYVLVRHVRRKEHHSTWFNLIIYC